METNEYLGGDIQHIKLNQGNTKAVQDYLNYYAIVGDDDNGEMMTEKQFEAYKKKVAAARANHLYVFYVNNRNQECKAIGPSSLCFCKHRYRNHNFDSVKEKKVNCKMCKCKMFNYIPVHGSLDIKCNCKHSYEDHDPNTKKCLKCGVCKKFSSNYTCDCKLPYDLHHTQIETRQERIKAGKGVDSGTNMAAGIGGLGSFTDMVGGAYNDNYKDLLEGNPNKNLPASEAKKMISSGKKTNDNQIGGNSNINPLDLFNKPNKFG